MYTYGSTHSIFMAVCVQVQTTTCRDIQMTNEIQPTRKNTIYMYMAQYEHVTKILNYMHKKIFGIW